MAAGEFITGGWGFGAPVALRSELSGEHGEACQLLRLARELSGELDDGC
ncbi:MAG: hypothetical protein ACRCT0_01550 [Plesiomonas shigelloides]